MDNIQKLALGKIKEIRQHSASITKLVILGLLFLVAIMTVERMLLRSDLTHALANNRPELFVLVPDKRNAGNYHAVTHIDEIQLDAKEATAYAEVTDYIIAHERYDKPNLLDYWNEVRLKSSDAVFREYAWRFNDDNEKNFYELVDDDILTVRIKSWLPAANGGMTVRYAIDRYEQGIPEPVSSLDYIVRVHYEWNDDALKLDERVINPFGFHVTHFLVTLENLAGGEQ